MCLGYPAIVIEVDEGGALVEERGRRRRAATLLIPDLAKGEWVLVAAGTAVRRLDVDDALALIDEIARAETITRNRMPSIPPGTGDQRPTGGPS